MTDPFSGLSSLASSPGGGEARTPTGPAPRPRRRDRGGSDGASRQDGLHFGGGTEGTEYLHRGDRGQGQLGGDIGSDTRQPQHPDMDHLPGVADLLQITTGVVTTAQGEGSPGCCLVERLAPGGELGTNGCADEIGAVGIETLLDQEVD